SFAGRWEEPPPTNGPQSAPLWGVNGAQRPNTCTDGTRNLKSRDPLRSDLTCEALPSNRPQDVLDPCGQRCERLSLLLAIGVPIVPAQHPADDVPESAFRMVRDDASLRHQGPGGSPQVVDRPIRQSDPVIIAAIRHCDLAQFGEHEGVKLALELT